jgi:hypothetical protein
MTINAQQQYATWMCPFQETNGHSGSQEFPHHLLNPKFHFCVYKSSPLGPNLNLHVSHTISFHLWIHLNGFL